jgi:hypothetical protein
VKFKSDQKVGVRFDARAALNRAEGRTASGLVEVDAGLYIEF